eukprot:793890-Prymnesium_polylepis.2
MQARRAACGRAAPPTPSPARFARAFARTLRPRLRPRLLARDAPATRRACTASCPRAPRWLAAGQVSYEEFGETKTCDLMENGGDVPVTEANRHEYVALYAK